MHTHLQQKDVSSYVGLITAKLNGKQNVQSCIVRLIHNLMANLSHERNESNLSYIATFSSHVWSCNNLTVLPICMQICVVWNKSILQDILHNLWKSKSRSINQQDNINRFAQTTEQVIIKARKLTVKNV